MFLKSLQIKGFKSFADAAALEFEPGVTVVVGPNTDGTYALVTRGYNDADTIVAGIDGWLASARPEAV